MSSKHNGIKLVFNNRKIMKKKSLNTQKLNRTLPNNPWVKEEVTTKILKYIKLKQHKNRTHLFLFDVTKAVQRKKLSTLHANSIRKKYGIK